MLRLTLREGEKIVVNGSVLVNNHDSLVQIGVTNPSSILRESDILLEDAATTPARRLYFAAQLPILHPDSAARHESVLRQRLAAFRAAEPARTDVAEKIDGMIARGNHYKILVALRPLLDEKPRANGPVAPEKIHALIALAKETGDSG